MIVVRVSHMLVIILRKREILNFIILIFYRQLFNNNALMVFSNYVGPSIYGVQCEIYDCWFQWWTPFYGISNSYLELQLWFGLLYFDGCCGTLIWAIKGLSLLWVNPISEDFFIRPCIILINASIWACTAIRDQCSKSLCLRYSWVFALQLMTSLKSLCWAYFLSQLNTSLAVFMGSFPMRD